MIKISVFGRAFALSALLGVLSAPAWAAETESDQLAALQKKLDQSIQMIQALAARVRELEASHGGAPGGSAATATNSAAAVAATAAPTPAATPADAERLEAVEVKVAQMESANATRHTDDTGLPIHGFADLGIANNNPFFPYEKGAYLNNLDLYLTPHIGGKFVSLFELNFEVDHEGNVGVDIERGQIGYQFSDEATLWIGRFHTPFGFVNTALHHGVWLNDALRRPEFLMFEDQGGILPSHTVGAWLTGSVRGDGGKVLYDTFIGNGQEIIDGFIDMRSGGNDHGKPIYGGRLGYQWTTGTAEGLLVGVHAFESRVDDNQVPQNMTELRVYGGYAVYDTDRWEHMAELYFFNNRDLYNDTGEHRSKAYFAQFGYRAPWAIPYVRYERALLDQTDQYFSAQMFGVSYYRTAAGFRYDFNLKTALKFEVANTHYTDRTIGQFNGVLADIAIRF
jgi:hypothetical protein